MDNNTNNDIRLYEYSSVEEKNVNNPLGRPEKFTVEQIATALEQSDGIKATTCQMLGCSYKTLNRYLDKYPELQEIHDHHQNMVIDEIKSILVQKAREGQLPAIFFYLKTIGGLKENAGNVQINQTNINNWESVLEKAKDDNETVEGEIIEIENNNTGW